MKDCSAMILSVRRVFPWGRSVARKYKVRGNWCSLISRRKRQRKSSLNLPSLLLLKDGPPLRRMTHSSFRLLNRKIRSTGCFPPRKTQHPLYTLEVPWANSQSLLLWHRSPACPICTTIRTRQAPLISWAIYSLLVIIPLSHKLSANSIYSSLKTN